MIQVSGRRRQSEAELIQLGVQNWCRVSCVELRHDRGHSFSLEKHEGPTRRHVFLLEIGMGIQRILQ